MKKNYQTLTVFTFFTDIGITYVSWVVTYFFRFYGNVLSIKYGLPAVDDYLNSSLFIIPIWTISLVATSMYQSRRGFSLIFEFVQIVKSCIISFVFLTVFLYFIKSDLSRVFLLVFLILNILFLFLSRYAIRTVLKLVRSKGYNLRHVLILGGGKLGKSLSEKINKELWTGYKVIGFMDDYPETSKINENSRYPNIEYLGKFDAFAEILEKKKIETVFIAMGMRYESLIQSSIDIASKHHVNIRLVPDIFHYDLLLNINVEDFNGLPIISLVDHPMNEINRVIKRLFDIFFSLFVLTFLSPVFLLLAGLVKISSRGPILYKQKRMSLNGNIFNIYKFRSMPVDAEKKTGPKWADKDENRTTKIGSFIRKTSLDELPQFLNVLWGNMSVVGPRPERPEFIEEFKNSIPNYMLRHKVKAGITGWAQVNGWRGNTSLDKRIEFDIFYINNWSLFFDAKIIFTTLYKGFINKNAY